MHLVVTILDREDIEYLPAESSIECLQRKADCQIYWNVCDFSFRKSQNIIFLFYMILHIIYFLPSYFHPFNEYLEEKLCGKYISKKISKISTTGGITPTL